MISWKEEEIMRTNGRSKVIERVEKGDLTMKEGAENVGLSLRQMCLRFPCGLNLSPQRRD